MELGLVLLAALLSIIAVVIAALWVRRKAKAQQHLVALLRESPATLPNPSEALSSNPHMSEELLVYQRLIEQLAASMEESDRERVLEGLRQPSEAGRARYIMKLLTKSGIPPMS